MKHHEPNPWKEFVLGVASAAVGVIAMDTYWAWVAPMLSGGQSSQSDQGSGSAELQPLDSISLIGKQYKDGESSTAALGRIIYQWLTGREPQSQETRTVLSYLVHWIYGLQQGGVYGAVRAKSRMPYIPAGLVFATGLWLFGDELVVPLLGLQSGPTSVPPVQHANRLGAHLAYGLGTSMTAWVLSSILPG